MIKHLPNMLAVVRLIAVPFLLWLILANALEAAFWLFVFSGLTDAVDGIIARRWDAETRVGQTLDPIADKALLNGSYLACAAAGLLPVGVAIIVFARDLVILCGALITWAKKWRIELLPNWFGKLSTVLQVTLLAVVLALGAWEWSAPFLLAVLIIAVSAITIVSGIIYSMQWVQKAREAMDRQAQVQVQA